MTAPILTTDDIAELMRLPRRAVLDRVVKQPGFPKPIVGGRYPRWLAAAVFAFFAKQSAQ